MLEWIMMLLMMNGRSLYKEKQNLFLGLMPSHSFLSAQMYSVSDCLDDWTEIVSFCLVTCHLFCRKCV